MESNVPFDPDAMAQQQADQTQSNHHFDPFQNSSLLQTTQGNAEAAKPGHSAQKKQELLPEAPFFPAQVMLNPNKHGIAIEITGEYLRQHGSTFFTNYKIQGYGINGEYETEKGFLDFDQIRWKLRWNRPGSLIPDIPHARRYYKYDEKQVEAKRHDLVQWLKEIAEMPNLFYYADFQEFLQTGPSSPEEHTAWIESCIECFELAKNKPAQQNPIKKNEIIIDITEEKLKKNRSVMSMDYCIKGSADNKEFETIKGYLDFVKTREKIEKKWTGCKVPALPSESLFTNKEVGDSEIRRAGLARFLKEIAEVRFLFYCEHFQEFLGIESSKKQSEVLVPKFENTAVTIIGDFQRSNAFGISHREYHIIGTDDTGRFSVDRRYKDFVLIREVLVEKWPEIKFQELPPKEKLGEDEEAFQAKRSKGLIAFLQSTTLEHSVFRSLEWQVFMKDQSPKITDKLKSFKKPASFFRKVIGKGN